MIQPDADVSSIPCPNLLMHQTNSAELQNIEGDMIKFLQHDHTLFRCDNNLVYNKLEIELCGTTYAATIVEFVRKRDG